ncbi:GLPGLI family protein [Flavobacterium ardleyense]|uniref:GLPGLI family protein n=1 Tax=Flavobacterium ardleyense TaxID=2038737 RepID=UPI00298C1D93|nr:GLPGLI family protein [Flavobacterium ardleyense]
MKNLIIVFSVVASLCSAPIVAQNFHGMAVFEVNTAGSGAMVTSTGLNPAQIAKMNELMKQSSTETYILNFNKSESYYEQEQKLAAPNNSESTMGFGSGIDRKVYKNIKDNLQLEEKEFMSKEFLVTDSLRNWNWQLTSETKKIGDYTCYKAVSITPVTDVEKENYEKAKALESAANTSILLTKAPQDKTFIAWYTTEIPIAQGPEYYWGLPGLILEATSEKTQILCSKIILNSKTSQKIKQPKKGKKVTSEEYKKIMRDKFETLKDANGIIQIKVD